MVEDLKPEDFLRPLQTLVTPWPLDSTNTAKKLNFLRGLETGKQAKHVFVATNNVWSASMKDGGHLSSYEKLGYHAGTAYFFFGLLKSGCPITVYRKGRKEGVRIK